MYRMEISSCVDMTPYLAAWLGWKTVDLCHIALIYSCCLKMPCLLDIGNYQYKPQGESDWIDVDDPWTAGEPLRPFNPIKVAEVRNRM